jgi:opacity protein-like surface antigen
MRNIWTVGFFILLFACPLHAQDLQRFEVFGGYTFSTFRGGSPAKRVAGNGWNFALQYNLVHVLGIKADFAGTYGTDNFSAAFPFKVRNYTYTFGPVVQARVKDRLVPFGELLFGRYHLSFVESPGFTEGGFAMLAGGGVDFKLSRHIALRAGPVDWVYTNYPSVADWPKNNIRVSTGLVFRF